MTTTSIRYLFSTITPKASAVRTAIFTIGHFFIDFFTIVTVTGSTLEAAAQASVVAPLLNGAWYFLLDRTWTLLHQNTEDKNHNRSGVDQNS